MDSEDVRIKRGQVPSKKKVTDFSIKAIMAERDQLVATVSSGCGFRKVISPGRISSKHEVRERDCTTPRSAAETPDTTTSDDTLLIIPCKDKKQSSCSPELANVDCHLEVKELWERFNELGTEMIITRSGRRMFPTIRASFSGLDAKVSYLVLMDIVTVDSKRYRYAYHRSSWLVAGKGDPAHQTKLYAHPDSPFLGEQLRKQIITFEKVKLTNTEVNKPGYIVLNSMHRYQPRIHLVVDTGEEGLGKCLKSYSDLQSCIHKTFIFPECAFYSVTAYQNQLITKLKIDCNPFAKGFRDSTRVISDMERESMNNGGMMPDSTIFCPYPGVTLSAPMHLPIPGHESLSDMELSHKLCQYSLHMPPTYDKQLMQSALKTFNPAQAAAVPLSFLQRWSLSGWNPVVMSSMGLDPRHLAGLDVSRQMMLARQMQAVGSFHLYQDPSSRPKDPGSNEK